MRWLPLVLAALFASALGGACQAQSAPPPKPSPTPSATPVVAVRAPVAAILGDAEVGLPRMAGTDHLTVEEAAASAPDQVLALEEYRGWGWSAAARRTWAGGGARVDDLVLGTDREEGARRAYAYLSAQAALAPLSRGPCPVSIGGLDECTQGIGAGRTITVGRLATDVFVLDVSGRDAAGLAASQAARLRAS